MSSSCGEPAGKLEIYDHPRFTRKPLRQCSVPPHKSVVTDYALGSNDTISPNSDKVSTGPLRLPDFGDV